MTDRPDWWRENERLREAMDLPAYEPPRFADGTHTHEVTDRLERAAGCRIRFVGYNTRYPDDWAVRIDGDPAFAVGRHRDDRGNTVYELSAAEFRAAVREHLDVTVNADADANTNADADADVDADGTTAGRGEGHD